jgi:DNA gyrase subunit B
LSIINALSARLKVVVRRDGKEYSMSFEKGKKVEDIAEQTAKGKISGTFIRFGADLSIFKGVIKFDPIIVKEKLMELSFLCKGLSIEFVDEIRKKNEVFGGENDMSGFIKYLSKDRLLDEPTIFTNNVKVETSIITVDVAMQWVSGNSDVEICKYYTNNIPNIDGGSHMSGFKSGLTRTVNNYISNSDLPKSLKIPLSGDDIREGLIAVVSIRHPDPKFSSQVKSKLVSEDARTAVESTMSEQLMKYLEQNPSISKRIVTRCVNAFKAREAARKAREAVRKTSLGTVGFLPGKLADCQERDPDKCEIFIVEGSSAGGCFSGDTMISLVNGSDISFNKLVEDYKNDKRHYCYTIRNGEVDIQKIRNPRKTKRNMKVIKLILDNGEEIVCTPDHKLMKENGDFIEAKDSVNISLKALMLGAIKCYNHKVVKIVEFNELIDVYDLEVPETHNFALASGIFVHNSAKQGRDRKFQAILPLRGKVLNIEKCEFKTMMDNKELTNLTIAIGAGIGKSFNPDNIRYGKIIIFCDADVDGAHIRTLLLTFFFRQMPQLIVNNNLYIAQPPLYKATYYGNSYYLKDDQELEIFAKEKNISRKRLKIQRFKGLGEMNPQQLWDTTMNPQTRSLLQVTIDNYIEADKIFGILMGNDIVARREFIQNNSTLAQNIDIT